MKSFITSFLILLSVITVNGQLWLVDPLEAIYPDKNELLEYNRKWKADIPVGAVAEVHILVKMSKGESFTISASIDGEYLGTEVWNQLIDVPVEENTGLDSRTEQFTGQKNPYVIRRAPFQVFEVIKPVKTNEFMAKQNYTAFRLAVPPSVIGKPGKYKIKVNVKAENFNEEGVFTVKVYPVELPELAESKFLYTNWFNQSCMEEKHQVERWTEPWFEMLDKYAKLMAQGRQNCIIIPGELFKVENDKIVLEEDNLLRYIDLFRKNGFKYFESPHLAGRGSKDDWSDPELYVNLTNKKYYKDNGKEDVRKLMELVKEFAVKNNLTKSWLQHIADEPTSVNAKCYSDIAAQVKEIFPEVKIIEATNDRDGIAGAVDIWCPLINDFQENESFFREREELGDEVIVYTCLVPGGKWLNRTLDMERLRQVYFGWGAAHYSTNGYLHWGLNQYLADPYKQSVVKHPSPVAGPTNYLPAGDTHIIYPGEDGPLSSIRFEAHRMGCEDYDLLQQLKKKNEDLAKKLIGKQFRSYTDYNLNLRDYRKTKRKLLKKLK
ncbi:MAG: DUF4091 domain-containing protein [Bacteroidota bacterium]